MRGCFTSKRPQGDWCEMGLQGQEECKWRIEKYKARLVAKAYSQRVAINYDKEMMNEFEMTDIRLMSYYLGIEVKQEDKGIFITQEGYAREVIKKFKMDGSNPVNKSMEYGIQLSHCEEVESMDPTLFKSLIGSLRYLTCIRLNILYAVGVLSRFMKKPTTTHLEVAKRILRQDHLNIVTNRSLGISIARDKRSRKKLSFLARVKSNQESSLAPSQVSVGCSVKRHSRKQGCWQVGTKEEEQSLRSVRSSCGARANLRNGIELSKTTQRVQGKSRARGNKANL
ncbi:putative mitochondrial protein [Cucumis melo var. makuwa]|uniref:Mitochondrial protein n=1 Tax=Cucumis melo var. makuwa TaxID=1194695 RepID=A0A5A7UNP0_CUCMM|nr:putative mitochondrial protein [Cucumis melo var. makuwa]